MAAECPLFTPRHVHHSAVWTIQGFSVPKFCVACATERLEDKSEVPLHCRKVLNEFQALLMGKNNSLINMMSSDRRVLDHLSTVVFGLIVSQDETIAQPAMEVSCAFANQFSTTDLPRKLMQRTMQMVMATQSFSVSLPYLTFLGRLLHSLPPLCREITHSFGGFLEYLLSGLAYPDENIKSAVVYILAQLSMKTPQNSLPTSLVHSLCHSISSSLASAKSHNLTLNLLGLVKGILKSSTYAQCLLQTDKHTSEAKGSTLASAFKRVLLSNDETLQISGVQCVADILSHHPQYGQTLLQADIAEFMFEALTSKKELLMTSLFSCLNSLATVNYFYSRGHIIYGIEQVISGLLAALEMKNYNAVQLGLTFLSNVLPRQPPEMPLFTAATLESLQKLLSVIDTALQTPAPSVVLSAVTTLSYLLCTQHLPPGFPLTTLLPLLSRLLHLVELHVMPHSDGREHTSTMPNSSLATISPRLFTAVLVVMENIHRICSECREKFTISEDVTTFLSISFEENILPAMLLNVETLTCCEPFSALFYIARIQLEELQESTAQTLALKLASLGFIHFAFDIKSKFFSASGGVPLCNSINKCVESLCSHLELDPQRRRFITDTLQSTLPDINCELERSLEFLVQRGSSHSSMQNSTSTTVMQLQRAVLILFYLTLHENERITPASVILQALNRFLVLNPDAHLMPAPSLTHLTALYAASLYDDTSKSTCSDEGGQILVRALLRVPSPGSVFTASHHLLEWAFAQPLLHDIARTWFWEWCVCTSERVTGSEERPRHWDMVVQFVQTTANALDILLNSSNEEEVSTSALSLIDHLLSEQCVDDSSFQKIFSYLQKALFTHRIQPLSDDVTATVLKLLAKSARCSSVSPDIKLVYHAINCITRSHSEVVLNGLNFLCEVLCDSKEANSQVVVLLQNNVSFLERLVSCVPTSALPMDHSTVSATALHLMGSLIYHQHKTKLSCSRQSGGVIYLQSALATLLHPSAVVLASGLYFWRVILSTGAYTGCFVLRDSHGREFTLDQDVQSLKKLAFLVQNCLFKGDHTVREAAALCLTEFLKYTTSGHKQIDNTWNRVIVSHIPTTSVHSHIPSYYLPYLTAILSQVGEASTQVHQLKNIAQLLYDSAVTERNCTETTLAHYASCFKEIEKIDKNLLDINQWMHLNKTLHMQ